MQGSIIHSFYITLFMVFCNSVLKLRAGPGQGNYYPKKCTNRLPVIHCGNAASQRKFMNIIFSAEENTLKGGDLTLKKSLMIMLAILIAICLFVAGCSQQGNVGTSASPSASSGVNTGGASGASGAASLGTNGNEGVNSATASPGAMETSSSLQSAMTSPGTGTSPGGAGSASAS